MKWFYSITYPNGRKGGSGPFDTESAADGDKATLAAAKPNLVLGDAFEEADDFEFPIPTVDVGRGDGTRYLVYSDGSMTDLS